MKFNTAYDRKRQSLEVNLEPSMTETAGYVSAKSRIEAIIDAGERLLAYREDQYDFGEKRPVDDSFVDLTRSKNFDMADASTLAMEVDERLKEQQRKAVVEASKKVEDERLKEQQSKAVVEAFKQVEQELKNKADAIYKARRHAESAES